MKTKEENKRPISKISKLDKKATTPYLIKKKKNGKVIVIKVNKQANKGKVAKRV
jgi:tRNA splicing ligase